MLFVTMQEDAQRLWIALDKFCLVEESTGGYNDRRLAVYLLDQDDPIRLDNEEEITSFLQALSKAHNNDVAGNI